MWTFDFISIIGLVAATLITASQIPQVIQIVKTKSTRDISLWTYLMADTGASLWVVYGVMRGDVVIVLANLTALVLLLFVTVAKLKFG